MELDDSVAIHQRNLQTLAAEKIKLKNELAPEIITDVFEIKENHNNLRFEASHFKREIIKPLWYSICTVFGLKDMGLST